MVTTHDITEGNYTSDGKTATSPLKIVFNKQQAGEMSSQTELVDATKEGNQTLL
jgi:hypothetical protein